MRYFTPEGKLVPTPEEAALWEKQQKELAQQEKLRFEEKNAKLAAKLRELNIDPDTL